MLRVGFGKVDITPRVGVGLYGYGPFLCRHSIGVREPLYARAIAFSDGTTSGVLVSCDLVGVSGDITAQVRSLVHEATGLTADAVCLHCIHTHCGPRTKYGIGQGSEDPPYLEILPRRIARACVLALRALKPAQLRHTVVPCVGIGCNREDEPRPEPQQALRDDWRPLKPERTDTEAHVLRVDTAAGITGFASYFSCHPVVGSAKTRWIHSDFAGVATNRIEREHGGAIGLFLQGCEGNINSCTVHQDEPESLQSLDAIADRYARQIRPGLAAAAPLVSGPVRCLRHQCRLSREPLPRLELARLLAENEAVLAADDASDADPAVRRATVYALALRQELARLDAGRPTPDAVELHGFRLGDLLILGAPFEVMIRYKQRVQAEFGDRTVLPLSLCNDALGYAPERASFAQPDNYAAKVVPYLLGYPPFAPSVEDELVHAWVALGRHLLET